MDALHDNIELVMNDIIDKNFVTFNNLNINMQLKLVNNERFINALLCDVSQFLEGRAGLNNFIDNANDIILNNLFNNPIFYIELNKSDKKDKIIRAIVSSRNPYIKDILENSKLSSIIISDLRYLIVLVDIISKDNSIALFRYILNNEPDKLELINNLNDINQWAVINDITFNEFYKLVLKDNNLFELLDDNVISKLIDREPFKSYFLSKDQEYIMRILKRDIKLSNSFSNNYQLSEKLKTIPDVNDYRFLMNHLVDSSYYNLKRMNWLRYKLSVDYFNDNNINIEDKNASRYVNDSILDEKDFTRLFEDIYIEEKRVSYYDTKVASLNDIFSEYEILLEDFSDENINNLNKNINIKKILKELKNNNASLEELYIVLKGLTSRELFEILIDRNFKDVPYNFYVNAVNLVNFFMFKDLKKYNIDEDKISELNKRLDIYNQIINFFDMDIEKQKELYNLLKDEKDLMLHFYEDFKLAQNISYNDYNNVVFNPDNSKLPYHVEDNIKIFELTGEDFYTFSHVTNIKRIDSGNELVLWLDRLDQFLYDPSEPATKTFGTSISLNSQKKMESFRTVSDYVTFGFCSLNPNRFAHVYHADSYSWYYDRGLGMKKINELETSADLIAKTRKYNEILYQEVGYFLLDNEVLKNYEHFKPSYLICYDNVDRIDILISQRMNIPILLIHTEYYSMEVDNYFDYNSLNEYIDNSRDGYSAVYKRK